MSTEIVTETMKSTRASALDGDPIVRNRIKVLFLPQYVVTNSRGWYNPNWHYENEPQTRAALDAIFSNPFSRNEPASSNPCAPRC